MLQVMIAPSRTHFSGGNHGGEIRSSPKLCGIYLDYGLLAAFLILLALGLVMVSSASISIAERQTHEPFYFLWRQAAHVLVGLVLAWGVLHIPVAVWQRSGPALLSLGILLLIIVLLFGHEVNGSVRWISIGWVNIQPSELMKLFVVVFLAGYFVKYNEQVRTSVEGFLRPMILLSIVGILLLLEPDFGTAALVAMTALAMMFLGGVLLRQFVVLFALLTLAFAIAAYSKPYQMGRLNSFRNPWADPYDSGFQLIQSLIAFGRGDLWGVGLGGSIQKLFYLPEAHTDFLFAVLAEELGLIGVLIVITLFGFIVWRAFAIGRQAMLADRRYHGFLAYGLGLMIGLQAFINIGVNMGVLPTKGLTLPLMSYGGSSIVVTCIACAIILRIAHEQHPGQASRTTAITKRGHR